MSSPGTEGVKKSANNVLNRSPRSDAPALGRGEYVKEDGSGGAFLRQAHLGEDKLVPEAVVHAPRGVELVQLRGERSAEEGPGDATLRLGT